MSEIKDGGFTPGPWRIEWIDSGMCNGVRIGARIMPPKPFTGPPICEVGSKAANARVIAVSLELLGLARQYRDDLQFGVSDESKARRIEAIEAVLAKAEGR